MLIPTLTNADNDNDIEMATSDTYTPKTADLTLGRAPCRRRRATQTEKGSGKSAVMSATNNVVANTANVAPKFPATETGMREVAENTAAGDATAYQRWR